MRFSLLAIFLLMLPAFAFAQDTNFNNGPQYLLLGSPMLARSISTPSYSLAGPPLEVGAHNATAGLHAGTEDHYQSPPNPDALPKVDFFPIYYGNPSFSVIEISFSSEASTKPISDRFLNSDVQIGDLETLHDRGYGMTLAEAAASSKKKTGHAIHVYTNADVERLHPGS